MSFWIVLYVDFKNEIIRIHRQQQKPFNGEVIEVNYTKNEKRHPQNGRLFILYPKLKDLLLELKDKQAELGITSSYIFCDIESKPLMKKTIYDALYRLCRNTLGLTISKNHAFRKTLNSSDMMQKLTSAQRGKLLGHSARVNEEHYTIIRDDKLINAAKEAFGMVSKEAETLENTTTYPYLPLNVIQFPNKKTSRTSCSQGF